MSRLRVVLCRVEEDEGGERTTEVARYDLPPVDPLEVAAGTALDVIEEETHQAGQAILRRVMEAQWEATDAAAVEAHCRPSPPSGLGAGRAG